MIKVSKKYNICLILLHITDPKLVEFLRKKKAAVHSQDKASLNPEPHLDIPKTGKKKPATRIGRFSLTFCVSLPNIFQRIAWKYKCGL